MKNTKVLLQCLTEICHLIHSVISLLPKCINRRFTKHIHFFHCFAGFASEQSHICTFYYCFIMSKLLQLCVVCSYKQQQANQKLSVLFKTHFPSAPLAIIISTSLCSFVNSALRFIDLVFVNFHLFSHLAVFLCRSHRSVRYCMFHLWCVLSSPSSRFSSLVCFWCLHMLLSF